MGCQRARYAHAEWRAEAAASGRRARRDARRSRGEERVAVVRSRASCRRALANHAPRWDANGRDVRTPGCMARPVALCIVPSRQTPTASFNLTGARVLASTGPACCCRRSRRPTGPAPGREGRRCCERRRRAFGGRGGVDAAMDQPDDRTRIGGFAEARPPVLGREAAWRAAWPFVTQTPRSQGPSAGASTIRNPTSGKAKVVTGPVTVYRQADRLPKAKWSQPPPRVTL
jgi:hypothetical protein